MFVLFLGNKTFENFDLLFLSLVLIEEYTSGKSSKEMHVHIGDKEINEKIIMVMES